MSFVSFHMFVTLVVFFHFSAVRFRCLVVTYVNLENIFEFHLNAIFVSAITYALTRRYTYMHGTHTVSHAKKLKRKKCAAAGCRLRSSLSTCNKYWPAIRRTVRMVCETETKSFDVDQRQIT